MNALMEYLPPVAALQPQIPQGGAGKYHGPVADGYDAKRESSPKWAIEQTIIEGLLADLPAGSRVLDCPVGTGRFLPFYAGRGLEFAGLDISPDMLVHAALKIVPQPEVEAWVGASNEKGRVLPLRIRDRGALVVGDIRQTGLKDKSVDAAVACRITRWLSPDDCQTMLRELQRVARQRIIWTARIANHPHARTIELFQAALDGWAITRNEVGYQMDYRVLMAESA